MIIFLLLQYSKLRGGAGYKIKYLLTVSRRERKVSIKQGGWYSSLPVCSDSFTVLTTVYQQWYTIGLAGISL